MSVQRRTGNEFFFSFPLIPSKFSKDVPETVSCVRIVRIHCQLCLQIHQILVTIDYQYRWLHLTNRLSFCIAIIVDGILSKSESRLRNLQDSLVSDINHHLDYFLTSKIAQLQKYEDSAPDSLEFERLKEHFEPFIRSSLSASTSTSHPTTHASSAAHSHHLYSNSITAAATAALARDIPGVGKYNPLSRSTSGRGSSKDRSVNKDEMPEYRSRLDISKASAHGSGGGEVDVEFMRQMEGIGQAATMEQRWLNSWVSPLKARSVFSPSVLQDLSDQQLIQRTKTLANTASFEAFEAMSFMHPHLDKTRTEGAVRSVQDQACSCKLSSSHYGFSPSCTAIHRRSSKTVAW